MNDDFKIAFDWSNIKDMYADAGSDISSMIMSDKSMYTTIQCNPDVDAICAGSTTVSSCTEEINELKKRLDDIEKANDYMRTDCKAMAEGLASREDKIKELEAEVVELKAMIKYCKENGIWAEMPILQMPLLNKVFPTLVNAYDDAEHLLDGLEIDEDEDEN